MSSTITTEKSLVSLQAIDFSNGATNAFDNTGQALTNATSGAGEWQFDGVPIRTSLRGGEVIFVLMDVCRVLGINNPRNAASRLDDDERVLTPMDTPGGPQELQAVTESGLYALIMKSRKPDAQRFRKWITSEVIPAIRKTGTYSVVRSSHTDVMEALRDPARVLALIGDYATRLLAADARVDEAIEQRDNATTKVEVLTRAHDRFASHDGSFSITDAAKTLRLQPTKLFAWLEANAWIYRRGGSGDYVAYQPRIKQEVLVQPTQEVTLRNGDIRQVSRVRITTKGMDRIAIALETPATAEV